MSGQEGQVSSLNVNERLDTFRAEMFAKFKAVEHKHRRESVTDDRVDWLAFDWAAIESHFIEEFAEYFNLTQGETNQLYGLVYTRKNKLDPNSAKEAVDVANMAFLLWWRRSQD